MVKFAFLRTIQAKLARQAAIFDTVNPNWHNEISILFLETSTQYQLIVGKPVVKNGVIILKKDDEKGKQALINRLWSHQIKVRKKKDALLNKDN